MRVKVTLFLLTAGFLVATSVTYSATLSADSPSVSGIVLDDSSKLPLPGVRVTVVELGRRSRTDSEGRFEFQNMPRGNFTIGIHHPGYKAEHFLVSVPDTGEIRTALVPGYQLQAEITVSATPLADEPLRDAVAFSGSARLVL